MTEKQVLTNEELTEMVESLARTIKIIVKNQESFTALVKLITEINANNIQSIKSLIDRKTDHTHWWL